MVWPFATEGAWPCLEKGIDFEIEAQRKKGRLKKIWKKQVEEESMKVGLLVTIKSHMTHDHTNDHCLPQTTEL